MSGAPFSSMPVAAIETQDLRKTYRTLRRTVAALQNVSLRVAPGMIFGLIGQNGAGKTTLIKILLGLSQPSSGSAVLLGGLPGNPSVRRRIGYLPEEMRLPEYLNAESFLRYMGKLNGVDSGMIRRRIPGLLEQVALTGVKKPLRSYSKGMQQRLGLAQALLNDPQILFLDEPTEGLDPLGRKDVRDLLVRLRATGKTVFLNSHLLSEIEMVCDQIVILNRGEVARTATPSEFARGSGEYVVRLATVNNAIRAVAEAVIGPAFWQDSTLRFTPRDRTQLNILLDRLRSVPVEIESIEPLKLSLEQFFLQVVGERERNDHGVS